MYRRYQKKRGCTEVSEIFLHKRKLQKYDTGNVWASGNEGGDYLSGTFCSAETASSFLTDVNKILKELYTGEYTVEKTAEEIDQAWDREAQEE